MARCTLDDLVPSTRCNRIFLEPIGTSYTDYKVSVDLSVYDKIEDEDGIADYFFTDQFKENIALIVYYSTDRNVDNLYNLLKTKVGKTQRFKPSIQSFLFSSILEYISAGTPISTGIFSLLAMTEMFNSTSPLRNTVFRDELIRTANLITQDSFQTTVINFDGYTNSMIEAFGSRTFNEDGNIIYDLKIDKADLTFESEITVQDSYLHVVAMFDIEKMFESKGVDLSADGIDSPFNLETIDFYFNDIDRCIILENKLPGSKVQDFRLIERISEIIRPAYITDYDNTIDQISLITGDTNIQESDISSELFMSHKKGAANTYYTSNIFFVKISNLLRRNAKYPFLHVNLEALPPAAKQQIPEIANIMDSSLIKSLDIYRVRQDDPSDRVLITQAPITESTNFSTTYRYTFSDFSIAALSYGKYRYELELIAKDPMEDLVESLSLKCRRLLQSLSSAISYIHNNAQGYDEIRDELSLEIQTMIKGMFSNEPSMDQNLISFQVLFFLFTKKSFYAIFESLLNPTTGVIERRKIESFHRIVEDLLFEVGKYYETKDISNASLTSIKNSSIFKYHRRWNNTVDADANQNGMIDVLESSFAGANVTATGYEIRTTIEAQKFLSPSGESSVNIGYLTPNKINNISIFDIETQEAAALSELFINTLQKSSFSATERTVMESMLNNANSYDLQVSELRNNSGIFESFLADQGATVTNKTAASINTDISIPGDAMVSKGIDVGRNDSKGTIATSRTALREQLVAAAESQRQVAKQQLMDEHTKKEDIISRILVMDEAYSILDRTTFAQGTHQDKRFSIGSYGYNRHLEQQRRSTPLHLNQPGNTLMNAIAGLMYERAFSRLILDNMFMVYYLDGFDANMNPQWYHLTDFSKVPSGKTLCKLKRFKSSTMHIGQGTMADREILSKYFYLLV